VRYNFSNGTEELESPLSSKRAPVLRIAFLFIVGILLGEWLEIRPLWVGIAVCGGIAATAVLAVRRPRAGMGVSLALGLTVVLLGALRLGLQSSGGTDVERLADTGFEEQVSGRISDNPRPSGEGLRFDLVKLKRRGPDGWEQLGGGVRAWVRIPPGSLAKGDRVELQGKIRLPDGQRNPGGFDYRSYLLHRGIQGQISVYDPADAGPGRRTWHGWTSRNIFDPVRRACERCLNRHLCGRSHQLVSGLFLGERERLTPDTVSVLREAGVLHILTVSGLHVGLVIATVLLLGRVSRIPLSVQVGLALAVCVLYAGIVGNRTPVLRATLMAAVVLGGLLLERDSTGLNSLAVSAIILLGIRPGALWEAGFQLSYGAVFGIVTFFPVLRDLGWVKAVRRRQGLGWLADGLLVSLSAQLGVGPFVAYHFYQWTPVSLLSNLLVLPMVGIALPLAAGAVIVGVVSDTAAAVPFAALWAVLEVMWSAAEVLARIPLGAWIVPKPAAWMVAGTYAGLVTGMVCLARRRCRGMAGALLGLILLVVLYVDPVRPDRLEVQVLDVGFGCAVTLHLPSGATGLVDGGDCSEYRDCGERVVVPYLRSRGIGRVDFVVLTHPHRDHFGGLGTVIKELEVERVLDPGLVAGTEEYRRYLESVAVGEVDFRIVEAPEEFSPADGVRVELIPVNLDHPCGFLGAESIRLNNGSLVVRITYGDVSILLPGDIEAGRELDLLREGVDLESNVIVVPHHGSDSSSLPEFIRAVSPEIAVISVGGRRGKRLPSGEVIKRYTDAGADVFRTDRNGGVRITTDGRVLWTEMVIGEGRTEIEDAAQAFLARLVILGMFPHPTNL